MNLEAAGERQRREVNTYDDERECVSDIYLVAEELIGELRKSSGWGVREISTGKTRVLEVDGEGETVRVTIYCREDG